jgi:hypothetical protein
VAWVLCLVPVAVPARAATPLRGIGVDEALGGEPMLADAPTSVPVVSRVSLDPHDFQGAGSDAAFARLDARLELYGARKIPVILALGPFPADDGAVEEWRQIVRAVAEHGRGRAAAYEIGDLSGTSAQRSGGLPAPERYAYLFKLASVQIHSVDPEELVLQGPVPVDAVDWQSRLYANGVAPYEGGIAVGGSPGPMDQAADVAYRAAVAKMVALVEREDLKSIVVLDAIPLPDQPAAASAQLIDAELRALGSMVRVIVYRAPGPSLKAALSAAAKLTDLLSGDLVNLDEVAAALRIIGADGKDAGNDVAARVPHRLLYSLNRFQTYLVYWGDGLGAKIQVEATVANATAPMVRDPVTGTAVKPERIETADQGKRLRLTVPVADHALIVDFNFGAVETFAATAEAQKPALLRVEEIVFRYQQAQAAQDAALQNYIAHVRMEQHFHPSPADPEYVIVTENRLFSDRSGVEWEELSFSMNGAKWTSNRPAFPLVQPEKVLSLPLDLRLNQDYSYRLDGLDSVGGRDAYVVRFEPVATTHALYRGTVWIDRRTFVRLKVHAVETRLTGSVVSNDETQFYSPAGDAQGREIWLLDRLSSRQIFLIAGRNVLVEREIKLSDFRLNAAEFDANRSAARASNRIMYRDTDQGIRYFVKKGETRVVSTELTSSVRAFALGTDVDPSFDYPLPIGGLDVLDFNFLNRDMQLALLFGGVIALGNIQHPNLWGGRFDASVDFFGLAIKANDSVFDAVGERAGERVDRIPFATGFNVGFQMTPFQKIGGHYELRYDAYFRDSLTAKSFVIPSSTLTSGEGASYEYRRGGYSLTADATAYQRGTWDTWGAPGAVFDPEARTYTKYDAGLSKDFVFSTFHTIHFNGTYFGGQRLDRFSRYQFGLFDATRMHGVPSAVRFDALAMFRGSYSFNLFDLYRFDLFVDRANGRNTDIDDSWRGVTGLGARVNLRAPRNTILQVDVGKSFLPDVYRGAGSTVVQVLLLKPL